jgi:asparagine synthase (glutamine-hydrolysing)
VVSIQPPKPSLTGSALNVCGIAGVLHADSQARPLERELLRMRDAIRHRGPDDQGIVIDGPCGLCHTRLSIIDLSPRGHQPMASASGRYWITYNGEIYNYRELREELRAAGFEFRSDSDTEVILQLMEWGGVVALERLEGMFAFALYDRARRQLSLVRDRTGIKPLFWTMGPEGFAFASEPKALPEASRHGTPPVERLAEYLAFRHWADVESPLPGVRTLLPGHRLVTDGRDVSVAQWWEPGSREASTPEATWGVISAATRRQLVSDVPVGIFLSGGVDSALVAAAARDAVPELETYTVGFEEPHLDETQRARVVSGLLGTDAHELRLDAEQYAVDLGTAVWHLDAPLNHAHSVHLLALSRFARKRITVALTGEGSDELFGGYPRYRLFLMARWLRAFRGLGLRNVAQRIHPRQQRWARLLRAGSVDVVTAAASNAAFVPIEEAAQLVGVEDLERVLGPRRRLVHAAARRGLDEVECLLDLERQTYLVSLLQRMDRMSMAAGLECRVPFLDERVIEHALSLQPRRRLDLLGSKKPVRRVASRRFGRRYANLPKSGFGVPVGSWLRHDGHLGRLLARCLDEPRTQNRGWLDVRLARRKLEEHQAGIRDHAELLWGVLNLELWARVCVDGDRPGETGL